MSSTVFAFGHAHLVHVVIEARKAAGLTQIELAAKLGRTQTYVSNIERGQRRIDVLEFYALSLAMGEDPLRLFSKVCDGLEP